MDGQHLMERTLRFGKALERRRRAMPRIDERDRSDEGRGRVALVTGASSGIGRSMAELLAAKGHDVIVVARRIDRLVELGEQLEKQWGVRAHPIRCDLSQTTAGDELFGQLSERNLAVDVLVNNAGYVLVSPYEKLDWDDASRFIRVVATNVAELTHRVLPHMMQQQWGRIMNIGSTSAYMAGTPHSVLYSASKSFVHAFTQGLAPEVEPFGILCTVSVVGVTDTEITERNTAKHWLHNPAIQVMIMRPDVVARATYEACMNGRRVVIPGLQNKVWTFASTFAPPALRYRIAGVVTRAGASQT